MDRNELLKGMDVQHSLFGTLLLFNNMLQAAGDAFYDEITCKQFFLLICLSLFNDEDPTINELSEFMGSTHQNVKKIIDKLEKSGFVRTYHDEKDKRKIRIAPTKMVQKLSGKYEERQKEFFVRFYDGITQEELKMMYKTLLRLENNLAVIKEECK